MGKEINVPFKKYSCNTTSLTYANKEYIQWIIEQQWSSHQNLPNKKSIKEDGYTDVIIINGVSESFVEIRGLKSTGNSFKTLRYNLKRSHYIPKGKSSVIFFFKCGFLWEPVNEAYEQFKSGDCILAIIEGKRKHCIKKA